MFTGIIEDLGKVETLIRSRDKLVLSISTKFAGELKKGDSVCVNGACLTVTEISRKGFKADIVIETISKTTLNSLKSGDYVNLERAMSATGRFDGHIVSGHIDTKGIITNIVAYGDKRELEISIPDIFEKYVAEKGSISIDGVSLTIASVKGKNFKVAIIPHTALITNLFQKKIGDNVNLEFDILAKYVEKLFKQKDPADIVVMKDLKINEEFLKKAGLLN